MIHASGVAAIMIFNLRFSYSDIDSDIGSDTDSDTDSDADSHPQLKPSLFQHLAKAAGGSRLTEWVTVQYYMIT